MAHMPGATWKPIPASRTGMSSHDVVCIHTCVGSLAGTYSYFQQIAPGVNSHFCTGGYGEIWQFVDTAYRSGANLNGNHRVISIENADMGPGFAAWDSRSAANVPAFTPQQIEANAQICAWAHKTYDIPLELIPDSVPGRRGIGYHRHGCDPYRVAAGEKWSNAYGKACPGDRRIAQIPQIIARARQIVGGAPIAPPEDVMNAEQEKKLDRLLTLAERQKTGIPGKQLAGDAGVIQQSELKAARREIAALRAAIAADKGVDPVVLERIITDAMKSVVTVDVNVAGGQQA